MKQITKTVVINYIVSRLYRFLFPLLKYRKKIELFYLYDEYVECKYKYKFLKYIPFYKEIKERPVVSKELYKKHEEKNWENKYKLFLPKYKMNTGGSTGEPYEFLVSLKCGLIDDLHQEMQHRKMGFLKNDKLYVINGCEISDLDRKNSKFWNVKSKNELPFGSKEFSSHYLNDKTVLIYLEELKRNPPQFIRSYPSVFVYLTKLLIDSDYKCPPLKLKGIQLTSEITSKQDHDFLISYWGDIIYFQYGHSEAATIASKYPGEDCYTFSPIYGEVEILDENNNPAREGDVGRIVVTSMHNIVRPFIRYDTGDLAKFKSNKNGVTKVYDILGRQQDTVLDKNNNKISVTGLVFGQHFKAFKNITNWQIENFSPGLLNVKIIKGCNYSDEDNNEIINKLSFNDSFVVSIEFVDEIKKTKRGKHKLVVSQC
ncbi:hypothetical protein [Photobacterium leiognathi]|uniref:hypothetical protein n=1 Tax=Photobacterium leiognathi TaxID=553611 RepID=UPI002981C0C9|nr:hypothetical protein [Photobacterium leiognathi]